MERITAACPEYGGICIWYTSGRLLGSYVEHDEVAFSDLSIANEVQGVDSRLPDLSSQLEIPRSSVHNIIARNIR